MKRLISSVNVIIIVLILSNVGFLVGMEEWDIVPLLMMEYKKPPISAQEREKHVKQAQEAERYNCNHPLLLLPKEVENQICTYCCSQKSGWEACSLHDSMKNLMSLSITCKKYNELLTFETIGKYCKNYAQKGKDLAFTVFLNNINDYTYDSFRVPFLILLCAGADATQKRTAGSLLVDAVIKNDEQLVQQLFKCKADPNEVSLAFFNSPIFFLCNKIEILKLFIAQENFNIHAVGGYDGENALSHAISLGYSAELIKFYSDNGVGVR